MIASAEVLFVNDGKPTFDWNYIGQEHFLAVSSKAVTCGKHVVKYECGYDGREGVRQGRHLAALH